MTPPDSRATPDPASGLSSRADQLIAELVAALEDLCSWETPLTQDKWDHAREVIAKARAATTAPEGDRNEP